MTERAHASRERASLEARQSESGFTLIEVMIAILLSAVAVIGVIGLYTVESRASTMSRRKTEAAMLAQDKVEQLRTGVAPTATGSGDEPTINVHGVSGTGPEFLFRRQWWITPKGTPAGEWYEIKVTVSWETGSIDVFSERGAGE